jgi:hypothetical protein
MNKIKLFSKVLFFAYHYSYAHDLEYSSCVMILAYELEYSSYVMNLAFRTLCVTFHTIYMMRIRAKLRWQIIVPSSVPMSYAYQSIGLESEGMWVVSL